MYTGGVIKCHQSVFANEMIFLASDCVLRKEFVRIQHQFLQLLNCFQTYEIQRLRNKSSAGSYMKYTIRLYRCVFNFNTD